uniref:Uncharacterized protein n=1 Tax=Globodera rostochiensis TaxID=31243 RepID=A0A914HTM0_GLORO
MFYICILKVGDSTGETLITGTINDIGMAYECITSPEFIWPAIMNVIFADNNCSLCGHCNCYSLQNIAQLQLAPIQQSHISLILIIIPMFGNDLMAIWKWNQIFGILLNISAASNAPILYFTSKEYRKAFNKEWQTIIDLFKRNSVQPY